jgi:TatD DNase family protein
MEIKYIDIHSHISFTEFDADREEILKRMSDAGVATINVGVDLESSRKAVALAEKHDNVFACIGAHPHDTENFVFNPEDFEELVKNPKVVAIGECGLDYFRLEEEFNKGLSSRSEAGRGESLVEFVRQEKSRQKFEFTKQIEFAIKHSKPLMIHIRDAHDDAYEILKKYQGKVRGNLHFYTGSSELAKKFIDIGLTISFPGVITFAKETHEAVKNIPLESMHAETDSPYAAPIPYRGKRNEPTHVIEVVKKIAEIRGEGVENVRLQLLRNAEKTFNISL